MKFNHYCTLKIPNERPAADDFNSAGEWVETEFTNKTIFCQVESANESAFVYPEGSRVGGRLKITIHYDRKLIKRRLFLSRESKVIYNGNAYTIYGYEEDFKDGFNQYMILYCGGPTPV